MAGHPLPVYIPAPGSLTLMHVSPASGMVGSPDRNEDAEERVLVYFEGNIYERPDLAGYADRVYQAACRLLNRYQTIACAVVAPGELVQVGLWDDFEGVVLPDPDREAELAAWLGVEHVTDAMLHLYSAPFPRAPDLSRRTGLAQPTGAGTRATVRPPAQHPDRPQRVAALDGGGDSQQNGLAADGPSSAVRRKEHHRNQECRHVAGYYTAAHGSRLGGKSPDRDPDEKSPAVDTSS